MFPNEKLYLSRDRVDYRHDNNRLVDHLSDTVFHKGITHTLSFNRDTRELLLNNGNAVKTLETVPVKNEQVTKVSIAFDQAERPCWTYSYRLQTAINGDTEFSVLMYFDPDTYKYRQYVYPGTRWAMVAMDDDRSISSQYSDLVLAFIRKDDWLCTSYQSSKFEVTDDRLKVPPGAQIVRMGPTINFKFQMEIRTPDQYRILNNNFVVTRV